LKKLRDSGIDNGCADNLQADSSALIHSWRRIYRPKNFGFVWDRFFQLSQPGTFVDPLTEVLRNGARALLPQAIEAEVAALLSLHADKLTEDGRQRLVRHGHLPEREIMTGIGPVAVRGPRVRDRFCCPTRARSRSW
jgi:hypothetical protein